MGYNLIKNIDATQGYCDILEYAFLPLHTSVSLDLGLRDMIGVTVKQQWIVLKRELLPGCEYCGKTLRPQYSWLGCSGESHSVAEEDIALQYHY